MKAVITAKSELRWPELVRDYTFDIISDEGEPILSSQTFLARPSEASARLAEIVNEYQAAYEEANDIQIGDEI